MPNDPRPARQDFARAPEPEPIPDSTHQEPRSSQGAPRTLFDIRGTGTHGPAPRPVFGQPAPGRGKMPEPIPANVAVREILAFINADPNTLNWGSEARQDLASTVIIAAYKAGHIGLWERGK